MGQSAEQTRVLKEPEMLQFFVSGADGKPVFFPLGMYDEKLAASVRATVEAGALKGPSASSATASAPKAAANTL